MSIAGAMLGPARGVGTTVDADAHTRGVHHRQLWCVLSGPPPCLPTTLDVYQSMSSQGGKPTRRGGEMSQSPTTSAATPDVIQDAEPTVLNDGMSHAPVFITEQQV